jgi:hypothetical protein
MIDQRNRKAAAGAISADRYPPGSDTLVAKKTPRRQRIFERGRERMLGRETVAYRERPYRGRPPGLRHHSSMADDRA